MASAVVHAYPAVVRQIMRQHRVALVSYSCYRLWPGYAYQPPYLVTRVPRYGVCLRASEACRGNTEHVH
jgi:hypothetical protein